MKRLLACAVVDIRGQFGRGVLRGVMRYASHHRSWRLVFDVSGGQMIYDWGIEHLDIVISGVSDQDLVSHLVKSAGVFVNTTPLVTSSQRCVIVDPEKIGRLAAEHFIERGFRNCWFYGHADDIVSVGRKAGYEQVLGAYGLSCNVFQWPLQSAGEIDFPKHHDLMLKDLQTTSKPAAIFAAHDVNAVTVLYACNDAGVTVPEEVAVLGVDNDDLLCAVQYPPLSSIDLGFEALGYRAAEEADRALQSKGRVTCEPVLLDPHRVVTRRSTDIIAIRNVPVARALNWIHEHACDPANVNELVQALGFGRRWIERLFRKELGRTPHQEFVRVRLERAKYLLRTSMLPMIDVAQQSGFNSLQHMGLTFRKHFGMTPAAYRRR